MKSKSHIFRFILLVLLAAMPVFIVVGVYAYLDPFRVIHNHGQYYLPDLSVRFATNRSYISTDNFNRNYSRYHYDSFIFGSSKSLYYRAADWQRHLPEGASIYHFDASNETLEGILLKMRYINSKGLRIKNALLVIDEDLLNSHPIYSITYAPDPHLTSECDAFRFHQLFFDAFRNSEFFTSYIGAFTGNYQKLIEKGFVTTDVPHLNIKTNEEFYPHQDSLIAYAPSQYYTASRIASFSQNRLIYVHPVTITDTALQTLKDIKSILDANRTNFIIIIPPIYHSEPLNFFDMQSLSSIFGSDKVFDFSGCTRISNDMHSFYDSGSHAIPSVCKFFMDSAYKAPHHQDF
jgi:hypothetical protein